MIIIIFLLHVAIAYYIIKAFDAFMPTKILS